MLFLQLSYYIVLVTFFNNITISLILNKIYLTSSVTASYLLSLFLQLSRYVQHGVDQTSCGEEGRHTRYKTGSVVMDYKTGLTRHGLTKTVSYGLECIRYLEIWKLIPDELKELKSLEHF